MQVIINSRDDLDAVRGTPAYTEFMARLAGSLWRVERDDDNQTFVAVEDTRTIERYGLTRDDFPDAQPPALPEWKPQDSIEM